MAKYKGRILTQKAEEKESDPSLKNRYEKPEKQELVMEARFVLKIKKVYQAVMKTLLGICAFVGVISLLRPELRTILLEFIAAAINELRGF